MKNIFKVFFEMFLINIWVLINDEKYKKIIYKKINSKMIKLAFTTKFQPFSLYLVLLHVHLLMLSSTFLKLSSHACGTRRTLIIISLFITFSTIKKTLSSLFSSSSDAIWEFSSSSYFSLNELFIAFMKKPLVEFEKTRKRSL